MGARAAGLQSDRGADAFEDRLRDVRGEIAEADKPREIGQAHTLGSRRSSPGISLATSCRPIARHYPRSATMSLFSGTGSFAGAARGHTWLGRRWRNSPRRLSQSRVSSTPGRACGLPSSTRGRSRVREFRSHGSVRGRSEMSVPTANIVRFGSGEPTFAGASCNDQDAPKH